MRRFFRPSARSRSLVLGARREGGAAPSASVPVTQVGLGCCVARARPRPISDIFSFRADSCLSPSPSPTPVQIRFFFLFFTLFWYAVIERRVHLPEMRKRCFKIGFL